ncbi:hypothetical protein SAMN02745753_03010 [Marinomonas polaris DSM 16579]|uniref:Uncharacterized protein n=1 Tax=Marinomonas polaris DSM 16579 TaxID=1122206 RepID=A0A1M5G467_9GAMM|nr:hypothetical protein [Marinomonas polaris]SHF98232.1 hypothetical protein SAMN02745753_03010 [Marinomonas polaris DSM 16579]
MNNWIEINRPVDVEADIPLKDQAPVEIKDRYVSDYKGRFIAWISEDRKKIGCIKNNRSISASLVEAHSIQLYEMEPAKGNGFVGLDIISASGESLAVIAASRYSVKSLNWLKEIQPILASAFDLQETYEYQGKDA